MDEIRQYRGTLTEAGKESPYRDRDVQENLGMFQRMKEGEFPDGSHVLRAKIDMASPNINMRDPVLYRIKHTRHHRTGDDWVIYPMTSPIAFRIRSKALHIDLHAGVRSHHRALYDWVLDEADASCHPQQIEFARLQLKYTVTSKRKLLQPVGPDKHVNGWDDPRMPTILGMRRRGFTPAAIRDFCDSCRHRHQPRQTTSKWPYSRTARAKI